MTTIKIRLNTKNQDALVILYTKFLGVISHIDTDVEKDITLFSSTLDNIPKTIGILSDYAAILAKDFPDEKHAELISIELSTPASISKLASLFSTPEETCNQVLHLTDQVKILNDRMDASKAFFFDYQQFHRLPEVLFQVCKAIGRQDILEDFAEDVNQRSIVANFNQRH